MEWIINAGSAGFVRGAVAAVLGFIVYRLYQYAKNKASNRPANQSIRSGSGLSQTRNSGKNNNKLFISIFLIVIAISAITYFNFSSTTTTKLKRPVRITEYMGVKLGDSNDQVLYALGTPLFVCTTSKCFDVDQKKPNTYPPLNTYPLWVYIGQVKNENKQIDPVIEVRFGQMKDGVISVATQATQKTTNPFEWLSSRVNEISLMNSEEEVKAQLGKPQKEVINNGYKTAYYPNYNLILSFAPGQRLVNIRMTEDFSMQQDNVKH